MLQDRRDSDARKLKLEPAKNIRPLKTTEPRWEPDRPVRKPAEKSYRNLDIRNMARSGCLPDGWFKGQ